MSRRFAFAIWTLVLALLMGAGSVAPTVVAQEATPEAAVAPPQDLLPLADLKSDGQTTEINGVDIYYEVYGEGDPVLLLHGGLANGDHYMQVIPELQDAGYQVIVMDSRGHGRSSFDDTPISYEVMANDVLGLMDHLGIDKADLVGWSDGGIIGLELAIKHPDRLNKVVAYGANFDPTGVRLDIGQNAYFNAYIARAMRGVPAALAGAGAVGRVPGQHLQHVGHGAELHRGAAQVDHDADPRPRRRQGRGHRPQSDQADGAPHPRRHPRASCPTPDTSCSSSIRMSSRASSRISWLPKAISY